MDEERTQMLKSRPGRWRTNAEIQAKKGLMGKGR